ncbi:RHS repeat domain-containing protein [Pseudomonas baetica]|uniref:RHS repeat domain-containing protein n=1 Tax=Pseudomonas baetica TaxID=674054 RepID=UPI002404B155|nr:RHS repeat-associated core domain-containing protein [Pseudomonas baetica]MDF9775590.1 insecticidal toxin complex protein TccC [Pseudomonas baetica]
MTDLPQTNIHHATPTLMAQDPRRQSIRSVAYYRAHLEQTSEPRINRQAYNPNGHLSAGWDPRLWPTQGQPNLTMVYGLSGEPLLSSSIDAGWKARLPGAGGELRFEWDGRNNQRQIEYDNLLRPIAISEQAVNAASATTERMVYADSRAEYSPHNQCGRLIRHDDTAGCLHLEEYSLAGTRLNESRQFMNELSAVNWPERLTDRDSKLEAEGETTQWRFNALGNLVTQTDARDNQRLLGYDIAGQLTQVALKRRHLPDKTLLSNRRYNVSGQIEHETAGNGVTTSRRYDIQSDRLLQLTSSRPGHAFQDLAYAYDPVGNITRIQDSATAIRYFRNQRTDPANQYRYDTLSQLIEASGRESVAASQGPVIRASQSTVTSAYKQTFSYDRAGNLRTLVHEGLRGYTREMVTEPSSNRSLPKPQTGEPDFIKSFDSNGNLLILSPGAQVMHWDSRNQLSEVIQVTRHDEQNDDELYRYDGHGQRLRKVLRRKTKSATLTSEVRYLPGLEIHYSGREEVRYVVNADAGGCNARILHWHEDPPEGIANDQIRYTLGDHLGSCTLELDEDAALISQEGYYAFGGTAWWLARSETEASYKTLRYSGKERDATGLYYYGLRYYAPWLQRWINPDPAGDIDGLNRYRMVQNNPLRFKDSLGLAPAEPIDEYEREMAAAGQTILYRRARDLPGEQRREFKKDFATMIKFTKKAISALEGPDLSRSTQKKLINIFGNRTDPQYLKNAATAASEKLKEVLDGALEDKASGNRFVFTANNPQDPIERAFSRPSEPKATRSIYVNLKAREQSAAYRAGTIFHELSHIHAQTHDYWYLFSSTSRDDSEAANRANMKEDIEASLQIAKNGPDLSEIEDRHKQAVQEYIRLGQETHQTEEHQQWAAQIAITTHNADSLTALALQFRSSQAH